MRLSKGSLRDYAQGINLSDITGELSGNHGLLRIDKLTARAAPGDVSLEGTIGVLQPKCPVDLKLTAKNAQPIANNIVTANLDADIQVTGTARERLDVAGKVDINRADVEIPSGLPPNVAVLDVRRPGRRRRRHREKPLIIGLNITVDAPRQILVKGRGLDAELGGELRIRGTTDSPAVGGGFELQRGFFTLASSKLTFTNGTVTFNGAGLKNKIDPDAGFHRPNSGRRCDRHRPDHRAGRCSEDRAQQHTRAAAGRDPRAPVVRERASQLTALQVVQIGAALATLGRRRRQLQSGREDSEGLGPRSADGRQRHHTPGHRLRSKIRAPVSRPAATSPAACSSLSRRAPPAPANSQSMST